MTIKLTKQQCRTIINNLTHDELVDIIMQSDLVQSVVQQSFIKAMSLDTDPNDAIPDHIKDASGVTKPQPTPSYDTIEPFDRVNIIDGVHKGESGEVLDVYTNYVDVRLDGRLPIYRITYDEIEVVDRW